MASEKQIPATGPTETGEAPPPAQPPIDAITKLEMFLERRWKAVVAVLAIFVAAVIVFFYLKYKNEAVVTEANQAFTSAATRADFEDVVKNHSGTAAAGSALFEIASRQQAASELEGAKSTLEKFVKEFPDHPLHYNALMGLGGISEKNGNYDEADGYFQKVVAAGDKSSLAALAALSSAEVAVAKGELEKAKETYEGFAANYIGSPFLPKVEERLAAVKTRIDQKNAPEAPEEPGDPEPEPAPEPTKPEVKPATTPVPEAAAEGGDEEAAEPAAE